MPWGFDPYRVSTEGVDMDDREQRLEWMRRSMAADEEAYARAMRGRNTAPDDRDDDRHGDRDDDRDDDRHGDRDGDRDATARRTRGPRIQPAGSTTVMGVRMTRPEAEAILRAARRRGVTCSNLLRRWIRDGLDGEFGAPGGEDAEHEASAREAVRAHAEETLDRVVEDLARVRESIR